MSCDYHEFGAYEQWERWMRHAPAIDLEREDELLAVLRVSSNPLQVESCRTELVERYQKLVFFIARRYRTMFTSLDILDVVQEGNVGLVIAIDEYLCSDGLKPFPSLAAMRIKQVLFQARYYRDASVHLPQHIHEELRVVRRLQARSWNEIGREATHGEIASETGMSEAKVADLLESRQREQVESIEALATFDDEEGIDHYDFLSLFIQCTDDDRVRQETLQNALQDALGRLNERERKVVQMRYGLEGAVHVWDAIAKEIGVKTTGGVKHVVRQAEVQLFDALKSLVLGVSDDSVVHPLAAVTAKPMKRFSNGQVSERTLRYRRQRERERLLASHAIPSIVA